MNKKRNRILTILVAAFVLGLLVWRLWPRSLESVCELDFDKAISVSAHTKTIVFEAGMPVFVSHHMDGDDLSPSGIEQSNYLLTGFQSIKCRPSFSNLLRPWLISGFTRTGPVDFLYGFVSCGDSATNFTLTDRGELEVGTQLYFITDESHFNFLWHHITTYGTKEVN